MNPAPDSPLQIPLQAAERLEHLGVLPPWDLSAPLGPVLMAALASLPGVSPALALWLLIVLTALLTAWAGARLLEGRVARSKAFVVVLLAPMQWFLAPESLDRYLFWRLATLLIVLLASSARPAVRAVGALGLAALMALTAPSAASGLDFAAFAEAVMLPWIVSYPIAPAAAAVGAVLALTAAVRHEGMPAALADEAREAGAGRVVGPRDLILEETPLLSAARRLVLRRPNSPAALLWLRALGARHVVLGSEEGLEAESSIDVVDSFGSYRLHRLSTPAPEAVLVSRSRLDRVPRIRGLQDLESLEAYILWASRFEAAGVDRAEEGEIRLKADAGPDDLILFRQPLRPGLGAEIRAGAEWREATVQRDPLGFTVLDPGGPGLAEFRLRPAGGWRDRLKPEMPEPALLTGPFPAIAPGSVVDGRAFTTSPFAPGDYLTAFGERFDLFEPRIRLDERLLKPLYASATQINFRLPEDVAPGKYDVRVESGGKQSLAEPIEVVAR